VIFVIVLKCLKFFRDVERNARNDQELISAMKKWLTYVESKTGMRPIIYTSYYYFDSKFQNDFKNYKFWIAAYSKRPEKIEDSRIIHWQFSEKGSLPGCETRLDFNVSKIAFY
jgi:lysozyme